MVDYIVRYTLVGNVYETIVRTSTSGAAIAWVQAVIPAASDIFVVNSSR